MWIITRDNRFEPGVYPDGCIPRSRDFLTRMTRKKSEVRKHVFRLMCRGKELFRGHAYFEADASFREILRPLDEFGRNLYDCDAIEYMMKVDPGKPGAKLFNRVPEDLGRWFDKTAGEGAADMRSLMAAWGVGDVTEITQEMLDRCFSER